MFPEHVLWINNFLALLTKKYSKIFFSTWIILNFHAPLTREKYRVSEHKTLHYCLLLQ
jgi:hypothetical protein